MKKKSYNDEIDLHDLIFYLWNNKNKIIIITASFIILGFLYFHSLEKKFVAITNIKPISTFEAQEYKLFNSLAKEVMAEEVMTEEVMAKEVMAEKTIIEFNQKNLLDLFINKIQTKEIIEEGIIKYDLINKDKYKDKDSYEEEIKKTAILIIDKMLPPLNNEKKINPYWQYNFEIYNKKNWRLFLEYLEKRANEEIKLSLIDRFNTEIEILETNSKFKIEDIEQKIENALADYKRMISNRLVFLEEQAEIARTLNIAKNTLEVESFQTDNAIVTNIKSENSYYLKGYEMIEKEISLIISRKNEKAFVSNLFELEKNKRSILQNKKIERLKFLFFETPVNDKNNFKAASIDYVATSYKSKESLLKIIVISAVVGFLISIMYIFLKSIIAQRK